MIELQQVTKLYGTVIGVNEISLSLEPGTYGLLGPNGSGKTTLINLILGQLKPTMGSVRLFGENPWRRSRLLRNVGHCPALEISYPRVTSLQWVTYMVQMHGFGFSEAQLRAKTALDKVKLTHVMNRPMVEYSLGMRQRAKLAQAIAHDPQLLILDEPFNGLDPVGRFEMTEFLREWGREGKSLVLASHILHEVEAVNPSFLLIYGSRLMASGSPEEVRRILANSPNTLVIRSSDSRKLVSLLSAECPLASVRFRSDDEIEVETESASEVCQTLTRIVSDQKISIHEVTSTDESLKALFSTLMRIHRGEMQKGAIN
ncbi:ABC transporter ATP-binding protein [Mariniblastus fucicola]|uniref:Putative ABC transporter ATP-binding protein YxlF n=1 Tax=Mariniblastus fucicola TaxID=980251 RepID=A0A5B9PC40_9BACT|nr:ABC transporter ATP-binding protein [Mariniblastus fucicola]QEG23824.1 putative ABC transporter ATP-binding protein YxlF [Mariniblastus fucicola]